VNPDPGPALVDARGLLCPMPVIEAARAARDLPPGTELEVLATDPATALDLPAWCRMRGHELLSVSTVAGTVVVRVRLG